MIMNHSGVFWTNCTDISPHNINFFAEQVVTEVSLYKLWKFDELPYLALFEQNSLESFSCL